MDWWKPMNYVTRILQSIEHGDSKAAEELLPHVYGELRKLAAAKMAQEPAGQTLQPTALVHEAWLRLVGSANQSWNSRGHFFAAAARGRAPLLATTMLVLFAWQLASCTFKAPGAHST